MSRCPARRAVAARDPSRWLEEYGDALYRYAVTRLRNPQDAEDVVQETLVSALKTHARYSGRVSEKTWLIGILKHKIVDLIRKRVRETTVDDIGALSDSAVATGVEDLFDPRGNWLFPPRDWGNPDQALNDYQFLEIFEACLGRLAPAHADIFVLKELEGLSTQAICNKLGITATNCGVMLYRARMGLRRCIDARWPAKTPENPE